jgi:tripartite-type tricarboxylate transporter receptor subunit TctC
VRANRSAASAEPDGYTLLFASETTLPIASALVGSIEYDPVKSFAPVASVSLGLPMVMVVDPSTPAKTVAELVAYAKANPGKLKFGYSGLLGQFALSLFKHMTGTDIVPEGSAASGLDEGKIQIMVGPVDRLREEVLRGTVTPLAVTGKTRSPEFPDVPTMIESGYPDYVLSRWTGILAPAGTPADIIAKLNVAIGESLAAPDVKKALATRGAEVNVTSPQEFATFVVADAARWTRAIKATSAYVGDRVSWTW